MICAALTKSDCEVEMLDISKNFVIDKDLKVLMALLYQNKSIIEINYSLIDERNIRRKKDV